MKLQNIQEVEEFRKVVHQCKGRVYLESLEGDIFNLKSAMSEYVALGRLLSEQGDSLELFASNREDEGPSLVPSQTWMISLLRSSENRLTIRAPPVIAFSYRMREVLAL